MRKVKLCALIVGLVSIWAAPSQAWSLLGAPQDTAPWCVIYDIGGGVSQENCRMPSFAACNRERAQLGGTAFCRPNSAFSAYGAGPQRKSKRKRYR